MKSFFENKIKSQLKMKMLIVYSTAFIVVMLASSALTYVIVNNLITVNIQNELENESYLIKSMIDTAAETSIKNHLRTLAETNLELTTFYYNQYRNGVITEEEAKQKAMEVMAAQKIGSSGYIYAINSEGTLQFHPEPSLIDTNISQYGFVEYQIANRMGYLEYMWKNPDDDESQPKALYMVNFEPWDWIISASSYKSEFMELINISDFEERILKVNFGKTGYPIILDYTGTFLVHPELKGRNLIEEGTAQGDIIKRVVEQKNGIIDYDWQNPDESKPRSKLTVFTELPEYQWIIAASSYKSDFYGPLKTLRFAFIVILLVSLLLIVFFTQRISGAILKPLNVMKEKISHGTAGDLSVRVEASSNDEIGELGMYFNIFLESLEAQKKELKEEICEKFRTAEKLNDLNKNLENIVDERTNELQASLKELQHVQDQLMEDIEIRKLVEKQLIEAKEEAIDATKSKSDFLANMSHELRTPMNGVLGITQTLIEFESENLTDDQKDSLQLIYRSGQRLLNLINGLLDLSKVEAGEMDVALKPMSLENMLVMTEKMFKSLLNSRVGDEAIVDHPIQFNVNKSSELSKYILMDEKLVSQVLTNLLGNAIKFTDDGSISLNVYPGNGNIYFEVVDTGIGISEENLNVIFEKFKQVEGATARKYKGTGLGLHLCKELVKLLDGEIEIESEMQHGTTARFYIPYQPIREEDILHKLED